MSTIKLYKYPLLLTALLILSFSCEREFDDLELAAFPTDADVFIDGFSGGLEYAAFGGSKLTAFEVVSDESYSGPASMRFAVPDAGDPEGGYAGGAFTIGGGRDLTGYDALTFWARASQPAAINVIGFGNDLDESNYATNLSAVKVNSNWQKYIIPIPDPSKLTQERGMFYYSEAPENESGYTFWIDEVKFEKLGTLARPRPAILASQDQTVSAETGDKLTVGGLSMTFNLPNGADQTSSIAPGYLTFTSSDQSVATVNEAGVVSVLDAGTAVITAKLGTQDAAGSLTIESTGEAILPPTAAPTPTTSQDSVISMFSNAYTNVTVDTWNPMWEFSTTELADVKIGNDDVKRYKKLNFVGILTEAAPIDASSMTHLHLDLWTPDPTDLPAAFNVLLVDFGANESIGGGDDSSQELAFTSPILKTESWFSLDIPLANFSGLTAREHIGQMVLSGDLPNVFVDNVYYYNKPITIPTAPTEAAAAPTQNAANVVSLFSDTYTDVPVDTWRTEWSAADLEDITIEGNATKKYSNMDFVGIETVANPVDASAMTHLRMDVWSADFTSFGIKLVDFGADGAFGGGDDVEHQVDINAPVQGSWVNLDIPLSDFTGLTSQGSIGQFILAGQPTGATTVYLDNVYFYNADGGIPTAPTQAAPTPMQAASNVVSLFSDAYTDVPVDTWRTEWSAAGLEDITIEGNATKKYFDLDFVGIETVANPVDASSMTHLRMDLWSADFTSFGIKLVDFGADGAFGGGDDVEHQVDINAPAQGGWVNLDIPLSDFTGLTSQGSIGQFILAGQPTGATTVYLDNVYFYNEAGGVATEPTQAAPTPVQAASNVVSLFSDAYDDVAVDNWRTEWSAAGLEDLMIEGNATKRYFDLDFVGIETVSNPVDASSMTHLHLDLWSADFTSFGIKLVDLGADGVFGGGDDVEFQVDLNNLAQGEWVSLDIPLSDFTGLTTKASIGQYILVGAPTGATTVFLDNFYFYN